MKNQLILWTWTAPLLLTALWLTGCEQVDKPVPQLQVSATLNGPGVRPVRSGSSATGALLGTIDPNSRVMTYTLTFSSGLRPTSAYLYRITNPADSTGVADVSLIPDWVKSQIRNPTTGLIVVIDPGSTSTGGNSVVLASPLSGTVALPQPKIDSLRNGYYYVSLGTNANPNGEIQGRVTVHQ